ncbi:LacI family DNA-binding transcriptional regulator [Sphingomonas alpina]|uniref:LacI family DNA-binding transcriptional regulator n=1 Tax=Sphingomonas alpina TaxID=653931 RepID=A0A7H0LJF2_9SPHN|nr:LacI family DNA-binding transcriptional regulator [Sphingomonas alpina]QNQ09805.1 LacI family DNA-binding transcriptional regulator [Sphingomonas alpina]
MATATIRDVARTAAVSVASASRALNGHPSVTPATRTRVLEAADALNYVPHLGARSLSTRRSNTIGVVLPDLFGEFFSEIIRGIDYAAHRRGLQLLLSNMHGSAQETAAALRAMRGRVDGLLVMSPQLDADFLAHNLPKGLPAVVLNGRIEGARHASIAIDNQAGAHAAVAHLVEQGCKRIAHLSGPKGNADADERARGFRDAVATMLGDHDPIVLAGDFSEEAGIAAGTALAGRDVDGIFSANDIMAIGCMAALTEAGRMIPGDIAMVGFDDVPIARYVTPALSTMRVHIAQLGESALERLVATIEADEPPEATAEFLMPELVVRASSARTGTVTSTKGPHDRTQGRVV